MEESKKPPIIPEKKYIPPIITKHLNETIPPPLPPPEVLARHIHEETRLKKILKDPEIRKGFASLIRTLVNAGVVAADFVPGAGDVVSWTADAMKMASLIKGLKWLDALSPAVSKKIALGTELLEIPGLGVPPTHIVETLLQLKREDLGRMKQALYALQAILQKEKKTYEKNETKIEQALNVFKDDKK